MYKTEYYSQAIHGPYNMFEMGDFNLKSGGTIRNCKLAYSTLGKLNQDKSNAVLIPTWYSGSHKIMEQVYTGKDRAIDTDKYFVIIANQLGGGLSSSPNNTLPPFNKSRFPDLCVSDDVKAQHKLLTEHLGVEQLELVVGGSLGAQQTYEWAVRYPEMVKRAAPIAGTAKTTAHDTVLIESMINTIISNCSWNRGWDILPHEEQEGLRKHARYWGVVGLCYEFFNNEIWKDIGFTSREDFMIGFLENYFSPMDANTLICQLNKHLRANVGKDSDTGSEKALSTIKAHMFVMPIDTDMLFTVNDCAKEQMFIPNSQLRVIKSKCGHFGLFGIEDNFSKQVDDNIRELLAIPA